MTTPIELAREAYDEATERADYANEYGTMGEYVLMAADANTAFTALVQAIIRSHPDVVALVEAARLLVYNERKADDLEGSGMVDNPHLKALRASVRAARTALAPFEEANP